MDDRSFRCGELGASDRPSKACVSALTEALAVRVERVL